MCRALRGSGFAWRSFPPMSAAMSRQSHNYYNLRNMVNAESFTENHAGPFRSGTPAVNRWGSPGAPCQHDTTLRRFTETGRSAKLSRGKSLAGVAAWRLEATGRAVLENTSCFQAPEGLVCGACSPSGAWKQEVFSR